ncbi:hypothetical protein LCGC14_0448780 [marine sediment metagenome]|uniref:Uncharacterized protein n=1 Tax=marine sediment metagenome TaxID=412755 RepID=A0A0F9T1J0_9ZZZZ
MNTEIMIEGIEFQQYIYAHPAMIKYLIQINWEILQKEMRA